MLLAAPQAGFRAALVDVTGAGASGVPVRRTTSGAWAKDWNTPAMALRSLEAESVKPKIPPAVNAPSKDQRSSILPVAGSRVAMALLPPPNSLKRIFEPSGCQPSQAAEAFMPLVTL